MLKLIMISLFMFGILAHAAPGRAGTGKGAKGKGYATRNLENGTKIKLVVGETVIPAVLNGSTSSKALLARLPLTVQLQRYAHDYCGVMDQALPYDEKDKCSGWQNGDIAFAVDGNYFTILYKDEEISKQFDGIVNLGVLCEPLAVMDTLDASIAVRIELD